jgi:hypothetical protein
MASKVRGNVSNKGTERATINSATHRSAMARHVVASGKLRVFRCFSSRSLLFMAFSFHVALS